MSLAEFLNMGGYAAFVWTAYGIAAVVLIANLVIPVQKHRLLVSRLRRRLRQEQSPP